LCLGCYNSPPMRKPLAQLENMDDESPLAVQLAKEAPLPALLCDPVLGALNDNLFKQSLILAILYKLAIEGDRGIWVNLCALLFIVPFFLFSALAGQFGEKYDKDRLIRLIKLGEIAIMLVGAAGFAFDHLALMLVALFAMGTHSALFGPVKYSILPQTLHEDELVGGNGLVEMGTFLSILAGTIGAGNHAVFEQLRRGGVGGDRFRGGPGVSGQPGDPLRTGRYA
jgi:MFS family permease